MKHNLMSLASTKVKNILQERFATSIILLFGIRKGDIVKMKSPTIIE